MRFGVLGPLELDDGSRSVPVGGPHPRALVASLVAAGGRLVGTDQLVDALWGDAPPRTAEQTLRTYVWRLRRLIGPVLVGRDGCYGLEVPDETVDARRFDDLVTRAAGDPRDAAELLTQALALWRGPAYASCADLPTVRAEARRLEEVRVAARERLAEALVAVGRAADAVAQAEALIVDHPYREGAWAVLVRALTAADRPADGLGAYGRAVAVLDDLGLEPTAALRDAQAEALRAGSPSRAHSAVPVPDAAPSVAVAPGVLPVPATALLGRDGDMSAVAALLDRARLVTVVGPGGVGKTRLALAVAAHLPGARPGARFVDLSALGDPAAVPAAMTTALGLIAGPADVALTRAGSLDVLAVVDNCEHLADAAADAVQTMLSSGTSLRVLATSREPLGLPGEHVHRLEPLATAPGSAAETLFLERATAGGARIDDDPVSLAAVRRIVDAVDGLPLAVEMAAAGTTTAGVVELADRLTERLDAVASLTSPHRLGPGRHRTMRAVIEWSEALLGEEERRVVLRWPVLAGPVRLDDAVAVLDTDEATVASLARRSLLAVDTTPPRTRYRMLDPVRAAVRARDPVPPGIERRHAHYVTDQVAAADAALRGPTEADAVARLDGLRAEVRAAHSWARHHEPALAARLSRHLHVYGVRGLHDEVLGWASRLGPVLTPDEPDTAAVHAAAAARLVLGGHGDAGVQSALRALRAAPDDSARLPALEALSDAAIYRGDLDEAQRCARDLASVAASVGDRHYEVVGITNAALAMAYGGEPGPAATLVAETGARLRRDGPLSVTQEAWLEYTAGEVVMDRDPDAAVVRLRRAVALADSVGNRLLAGVARVSATSLMARTGPVDPALRAFLEVIDHWALTGDRAHLVTTLRNLVDLLARAGADAAAARLWGAVVAADPPTYGDEAARLDRARAVLAPRLGDEEFAGHAGAGAVDGPDRAAVAAARAVADILDRGQDTTRR